MRRCGPGCRTSSLSRRSTRTSWCASSSFGTAGLARGGRLPGFVAAVGADAELDAETKAAVLELARDETFLLVCEDYMRATAYLH